LARRATALATVNRDAFSICRAVRLANPKSIPRGITIADKLSEMKVEPPAPSPTEVAADLFTRAAKIVPDEPEPFIILGVLCVIKSDYEAAIRHMKSALENDPSDYTLWNKLGAVQVRLDAISQRLCSSSGASSSGAYSGCCCRRTALSASKPRRPTSGHW